MNRSIIRLALTAALACSQAGYAQPFAEGRIFDSEPVSEDILATARGGQSPFAPLTTGALVRLADDNTRADLRLTGGTGKIQMDVWWGIIGSELIAENVRNASMP